MKNNPISYIIEETIFALRRGHMIFKVYFQDNFHQVPVRENTKAIYVEGETEEDVRYKLKDRDYNIEFVTPISGAFLEYEQQNPDFTVEKI